MGYCIVFTLVFLFLVGLRIYKFYEERSWDYPGNFVVLDADTMSLTIYKINASEIDYIKLPQDAYVLVPGGYGYYRIKSLPELGKVEKKGNTLLADSVQYALGVPIDAVAQQLNAWDHFQLWQYKQSNKTIEERDVDLSQYPIFTAEKRIDGETIDKVDPTKVDFYLKDLFIEKTIRTEDLAVGVFNASSIPGAAQKTARLLEHMGMRVVEVSNWNEVRPTCQLYIRQNLLTTNTYFRLLKLLPCELVESSDLGRFDVKVVVSS